MKFFRRALATLSIMFVALPTAAQMGGGMMGHAPPVPMTPAQFFAARVGDKVQISIRVDRRNRANVAAELLQHESQTLARRTGKHLMLYVADGTPVVMGRAADVASGAVLFVYGILTKSGHVDAKRVVVDTQYVRVR